MTIDVMTDQMTAKVIYFRDSRHDRTDFWRYSASSNEGRATSSAQKSEFAGVMIFYRYIPDDPIERRAQSDAILISRRAGEAGARTCSRAEGGPKSLTQ